MYMFDLSVQDTVKLYGAKKLADEIGMKYKTLLDKCNPNCPDKFSTSQYRRVLHATKNFSSLHALNTEFGLEAESATRHIACIDKTLIRSSAYHASVVLEVAKANEDKFISTREMQRCQLAHEKAKQALTTLFSSLHQKHVSDISGLRS